MAGKPGKPGTVTYFARKQTGECLHQAPVLRCCVQSTCRCGLDRAARAGRRLMRRTRVMPALRARNVGLDESFDGPADSQPAREADDADDAHADPARAAAAVAAARVGHAELVEAMFATHHGSLPFF